MYYSWICSDMLPSTLLIYGTRWHQGARRCQVHRNLHEFFSSLLLRRATKSELSNISDLRRTTLASVKVSIAPWVVAISPPSALKPPGDVGDTEICHICP